jgi:hypothetical protein
MTLATATVVLKSVSTVMPAAANAVLLVRFTVDLTYRGRDVVTMMTSRGQAANLLCAVLRKA